MNVIGHRGAKGLAPENTLAALQAALAAGAHAVEIDVRVTHDGVCVLSHDPYPHNAAGKMVRSVPIALHTFAEITTIQPSITSLAHAIRFVNRRVPMIIEIKSRVRTGAIITELHRFLEDGWQPDDFIVASFSQRILKELHAAFPNIDMLVLARFSSVRARWRAKQLNTTRLAFNHHNLWAGFIRAMRARGYRITVYTLNDTRKAARWQQHGLDDVITDNPEQFIHKK